MDPTINYQKIHKMDNQANFLTPITTKLMNKYTKHTIFMGELTDSMGSIPITKDVPNVLFPIMSSYFSKIQDKQTNESLNNYNVLLEEFTKLKTKKPNMYKYPFGRISVQYESKEISQDVSKFFKHYSNCKIIEQKNKDKTFVIASEFKLSHAPIIGDIQIITKLYNNYYTMSKLKVTEKLRSLLGVHHTFRGTAVRGMDLLRQNSSLNVQ